MNEVDWLSGVDPGAMLAYLEGKASDRKLRLYACACARRYWDHLSFNEGAVKPATPERRRARDAVEVAERYAEGEASDGQLEEARQHAEMSIYGAPQFEQFAYQAAHAATLELAIEAARQALESARLQAVREAAYEVPSGHNEARYTAEASAAECRVQGVLIREIFGNPFRPIKIDLQWLKCEAGAGESILQTIWEDQCYAELPYLADALMDAGCQEEALLRHLREPTGHVRGCWAVDVLMGRE